MNQRILLSIIAVTSALLVSGYGNAEALAQNKNGSSVEQPPQEQLPQKTNQPIAFKGIPLGKPGVKDALQKMCKGKKFNTTNDRCAFTDEKSMILVDFESLTNAFALVTVSNHQALTKVVIDGSTQQMLALAKALEKKYGKPLKKTAVVKKAIGTQLDKGTFVVDEAKGAPLDKETFVWVDNQGSRITVESIYSDYDKGGVTIESSSAAAQDTAENKAKAPGK